MFRRTALPLLILCLAVFALSAPGFGKKDRGTKGPTSKIQLPQELRIAVASNMKYAFDQIKKDFEFAHPLVDLKVSYGSSGSFYAQLKNKAPFDIFLSADTAYPGKLIESGLARKNHYFIYALGRLVLWAPNNNQLEIGNKGMTTLKDASVRKVALANPKLAPYGRAAVSAMKKHGVYKTVQSKLVLGENVSQTAQFLQTGAADLGFIPLSLAKAPVLTKAGRFLEIPMDDHIEIEQAGIIMNHSSNLETAQLLVDYILGKQGRKTLTQFGYSFPAKQSPWIGKQ